MKVTKRFGVLFLSLLLSSSLFSCTGPQGEKGETGNGIAKIEKTETNGNIDTYTITYTDGSTYSFQITNGEDGEAGLKGEQGLKGDQGEQGVAGKDGTSLISGHGTPNNNVGKIGDSYIDLESWDYYLKEESEWKLVCNMKGNQADYDGTEGLAFYPINESECAVGVGTAKLLEEIRIPSTYKDYKVTQIISEGFEECINLKSLYFPKTIKYCGRYAFSSCNISNVYYDGTILDWCNINFESSSSSPMSRTHFYTLNDQNEYQELKILKIPESITSLSNEFNGFSYVTYIYFPKEITKSSGEAFYNCYSVKTLYYKGTLNDWYDIYFSGYGSNPLIYADEFYVYTNNRYQIVTEYRVEDGSTSSSYSTSEFSSTAPSSSSYFSSNYNSSSSLEYSSEYLSSSVTTSGR